MKKRILIPTDFSLNAFNAIKYAMELFKKEDCEFFILHTHYLSGYSKENLLYPEPTDAEKNKVLLNSDKKIEQLQVQMSRFEINDNHTFHYSNEFGPFLEVMQRTVEDKDIELVIMGTRGQTDNKTVILGSNSVNIMEKIRHCPVIAIPSNVIYKNPNEIVFPTSYRSHYQQNELQTMVDVARLTNAPIRILHIQKEKNLTENQLKNKTLLETIIGEAEFTHHTLYDIDLKDGVRCFVQSRASEMIAFVNKKHNFFGSIFSNPMVRELGKHANVPLLAMHDLRNK